MAETEKRPLDASDATNTTPPTKKARKARKASEPAPYQSEHPGVVWNKEKGKWRGSIQNKLKKTKSGGQKKEHTTHFADEAECIEATKALRAKVDAEFDETVTEWADEDPRTKGLERAPKDWTQAKEGVVYWTTNPQNGHKPYRALRPAGVQKDGTVRWPHACNHESGCHKYAVQAVKGGPREFCFDHGGKCPHGRNWTVCPNCNPKITKSAQCCSNCGQLLNAKRRECHGGNKLCTHCEAQLNAEAAANGSVAPPPKGKTWEDVVLDALIPLVRHKKTGLVYPPTMRDDHQSTLGSNGYRNKGQCDTDRVHRPDLLYIKRDKRGRMVAALVVEVDEHSHEAYNPACEAARVDNIFQSLLAIANKEAEERGWKKHYIPFVHFLKFNPNACDAAATGGGVIKLDVRIKVLARACRRFLTMSPEIFKQWSDEGLCNTPVVACLYYHTKEGGKHLDYFHTHAGKTKAWRWMGNRCRKKVARQNRGNTTQL